MGGTKDASGLIHVGAREYDPQLNRFISVDPVQDYDDPLSWNAYSYSNNSPVTFSDPTGLAIGYPDVSYWSIVAKQQKKNKASAKKHNAPKSPPRNNHGSSYNPPPSGPGPVPPGTAQHAPVNNPPANPLANFIGGFVNGLVDSVADTVFMAGRGVGLLAQATPWGHQVNQFVDNAEKQYQQTTRSIATSMGLDPDSAAYGAGKITGEIASMAIPGGAALKFASKAAKLAKGAEMADSAASVARRATKTGPNLVYRGLAAGENPAAGLVARAPNATGVSPVSHVAGKVRSPWISTTKSLQVARSKYGQNGVVAIDMNRVSSEVVDISGGIVRGGRMSSWAKADQEVLIRGSVPPEAIVGSWP